MDSTSSLGPTDQQTNIISNLIYTYVYVCECLESSWSVGPLVPNYSIIQHQKFSVFEQSFLLRLSFLSHHSSIITLSLHPFNLSTSIAMPTVAFSRICSKLSERCVSYGSYAKAGLMIYFSAAGGAKRTRLAAG